MASLATLSAGFVINDIPFKYVVGTDAWNEDRLVVGSVKIYHLSDCQVFYLRVPSQDAPIYFEELEDVIKYLKEGIEE